jgi:(p)ppGpp synthase/HD superfamily hydrolase
MTWQPSPLLGEAIIWALERHKKQERKGAGTPYIGHLLSVAGLVIEFGGDEEQAIAGMLHDLVEDGHGSLSEVEARFGARVAAIVQGCTDADTLPKPPWRARKEAYIAHLKEAPSDVLLVSAADKLHNARAILTDLRTHGDAVFNRFRGGREGTIWYYMAVSAVFDRCMPGPLATELDHVVANVVAESGVR